MLNNFKHRARLEQARVSKKEAGGLYLSRTAVWKKERASSEGKRKQDLQKKKNTNHKTQRKRQFIQANPLASPMGLGGLFFLPSGQSTTLKLSHGV